jgi:hypothetical protein
MVRYLHDGGRAAIVLPDGSLTGDGVKARIRQHLLGMLHDSFRKSDELLELLKKQLSS